MTRREFFVGNLSAVICLFALCSSAVMAQPEPAGPDFQVNTDTVGQQGRSDVASFPDGSFVVVWSAGWGGGKGATIRARRFEPDGAPAGDEFQVNTYAPTDHTLPRVSAHDDGSFVVVWQGSSGPPPDLSLSIQAQRFDAADAPLGGELQVNTYFFNEQGVPAVANSPDGGFVVVWESDGSDSDPDGASIQARLYDAAGVPTADQFQANLTTTGHQKLPSVARLGDRDFVVTWYSTDPETGIFGRVFSGSAEGGDELQVNTNPISVTNRAPVAAGDGTFLVAWEGRDVDDISAIQGRLFAVSGEPLSDEFRVNDFTTSSQENPDVVGDGAGAFLVTWDSGASPGSDDSGTSVQARRFEADASPSEPQFQVNSFTMGLQVLATVGLAPDGSAVYAWTSDGSSGSDSDGSSVQARRYLAAKIFADGFESGDTSAWSTTVP